MPKKKAKIDKKNLLTFILATVLVFLFFIRFFSIGLPSVNKSITGGIVVSDNFFSNLLIPSGVSSIIFSVVALLIMMVLILNVKKKGVEKTFPFRNYVAAISMVFVIYLMNYFITLFPYGNLTLVILSLLLQIMIYGLLLPYILVAQISYIVILFRGHIEGILK